MDEVWRDIPGYPFYQASSNGRIRSVEHTIGKRTYKSCVLKQRKSYLYMCVAVQVNHKSRQRGVHNLVLKAFKGLHEGLQCRHLNSIATDNRIENLCWGTAKDNAYDRTLNGTTNRGEKHASSKLTWEQVDWMRERFTTGFYSIPRLARIFEMSYQGIYAVLKFETWNPEYRKEDTCLMLSH